MTGVEHQVIELLALIDKQVVDAHLFEVNEIIGAVVNLFRNFNELCLQIGLALLQALQHHARNILAAHSQHFKIVLYTLQLGHQNFLLHFRRLRYLAELVVRHNHTVKVIVLNRMEKLNPILRREVFFAGIQDAGIGIGCLIRCCNLSHVCLQTYNHRLLRHAETLHLMRCDAHDERLTRTYLMVAYSATVLFDHPHTILLRGIDAADAVAQL